MSEPTYAVYDTEITTRSTNGFAASPFCPENELVLGGYMLPDGTVRQARGAAHFPHDAKLIVGANIKFDLLWAARAYGTTPAALVKNKRIWDVCHVEYLLQRQRVRMPSLEVCAMLRGVPMVKHALSYAIKNGTCPSTVSASVLADYHKQDLVLTHAVFLAQFKAVQERGMLPLVWSQMQALVATAEMEHNGVRINLADLAELRTKYNADISYTLMRVDGLFTVLAAKKQCPFLEDHYVTFGGNEIISSNKLLSLVFFGGTHKRTVRKCVGAYKNGKPKMKNEEETVTYVGILPPHMVDAAPTKTGSFTVDEAVLKSILKNSIVPWTRDLAEMVLKYRASHKQLTTYVDGVAKHVWPDSHVHCNFNHNVTLTGRLSCSNPNLQNQTDGEIKRVFIPTHPHARFVEFDYSQLEVVGLAVLSGDRQLLEDIVNGVDIHTALYEDMYGRTPTKEERKLFKPLTFGLIYGAGPNTMAENSGLSKAEAKRFIATFYKRYPGVEAYHNDLIAAAKTNRKATALKTDKGYPRGQYVHRLFTGREFEFLEYDNDFGGVGKTSFSPTEIKNWPIQGWSTGDVVPLMVGYVVAEITKSEWYGIILPKLTVHDSIMFEIKEPSKLTEARNYLVELMSKTRAVIHEQFGYDIGLELKTEHKTGTNWKDMTDA